MYGRFYNFIMLSLVLFQFKCPNSPIEGNYGNVHKPDTHTHKKDKEMTCQQQQQQAGSRKASPSVTISHVRRSLAQVSAALFVNERPLEQSSWVERFGLEWLDAPMPNLIWGPLAQFTFTSAASNLGSALAQRRPFT